MYTYSYTHVGRLDWRPPYTFTLELTGSGKIHKNTRKMAKGVGLLVQWRLPEETKADDQSAHGPSD